MIHLFHHCLQLSNCPKPWWEAKVIILLKSSEDPKFPQIHPLPTVGKLFKKVILKLAQRHTQEVCLIQVTSVSMHITEWHFIVSDLQRYKIKFIDQCNQVSYLFPVSVKIQSLSCPHHGIYKLGCHHILIIYIYS